MRVASKVASEDAQKFGKWARTEAAKYPTGLRAQIMESLLDAAEKGIEAMWNRMQEILREGVKYECIEDEVEEVNRRG